MIAYFAPLFATILLAVPNQDQKAPVPDAAARKTWVKELHELYREQYAKRDASSRKALATPSHIGPAPVSITRRSSLE